jgi:2,4-dienoyl-CoA reductase-like NADH-dependent reductase (Old Yellow Enzyme family)
MKPHPIPPATWPTREEAAESLLFSPLRVGAFTARHRTWVPAMVPWRATADGDVTRDVLDWYGRFADGRPGVLVVEATGIRDVPSGPLLRIGHDRHLDGLRELVDTVRERSGGETRLLIQVIDFLAIKRRPEKDKFVRRFLRVDDALRERASAVVGDAASGDEAEFREALLRLPHEDLLALLDERERESLEMGYRERVDDLHLPHVAELPRTLPGLFADAAERARKVGFDGAELHFAHAYTMASFLSATNRRTDGYGGDREGRVRLPLEVLAAVRERVGADYTVGCRYLGHEVIAGGSDLDDAVWFGERFARAGMDFLSVSKGGKFDDAKQPRVGEAAYPYTGPSGHECMPTVRIDPPGEPGSRGPFGRNLPLAAAIRARLRELGLETPVVGAGGVHDFALAEAALRDGACDLVAAARQTLADPDWFEKVRLGRGAEVRRCTFTNYCEGLDQRHKQVTCQLWDRDLALPDPGGVRPRMSSDGKRRLVPPAWSGDRG